MHQRGRGTSESDRLLFDSDGMGSIPAIPDARNVPSLLCHERFSLPDAPAGPGHIRVGPAVRRQCPHVSARRHVRVGRPMHQRGRGTSAGESDRLCDASASSPSGDRDRRTGAWTGSGAPRGGPARGGRRAGPRRDRRFAAGRGLGPAAVAGARLTVSRRGEAR